MNVCDRNCATFSFDFNDPQWRSLRALIKGEVAVQNKENRNPIVFNLNIIANFASKREDFLMITKDMDDSIKKFVMKNQTVKYLVQPELRIDILKNLRMKVVITPFDETLEREHKLLLKVCREEIIPQLKKIYSTINFKFESIFNVVDITRYSPRKNMVRIVYLVYNRRQKSDISQKDMEGLFEKIRKKNPKINFSYIYNNFEPDKDYMILNFEQSMSIKGHQSHTITTARSPVVHKNVSTVKTGLTTQKFKSEKTTIVSKSSEKIDKTTITNYPLIPKLPSNGYHKTSQESTENKKKNTENMKENLLTQLETSSRKTSISATTDDMISTGGNALTKSVPTTLTKEMDKTTTGISNCTINKENIINTMNKMLSSNGYSTHKTPQLAKATTTETSETIFSKNSSNAQLTMSLPTAFVSSIDSKNVEVSRSSLHKSLTSLMGRASTEEMPISKQMVEDMLNTSSTPSNELPKTWFQMIKDLFNLKQHSLLQR